MNEKKIFKFNKQFFNNCMSRKSQKDKKRKEFQLQFDQDHILDGKELIQYGKSSQKIKLINSIHTIDAEEIQLVDIRLKFKGGQEEKLFADSKLILENMRRGISVAIYYDKNTTKEYFQICRRGLKKFFDLYWEFIYPDIQNTWVSSSQLQAKFRALTLEAIENTLKKEKEIIVYSLQKANGENSQISYYRPLDSWIISSKNAAIITKKELNQDPRYKYARQVAEVWFQHLETLSEEQISEIKSFLENHTLIGEFCGGALTEHFVTYNKSQLIFFAIVNHQSSDPCLNPQFSFDFFKRFNFEVVKVIESFSAKSIAEFQSKLSKIYRQVAEGTLESEGEGCVIYFVDGVSSKCHSLAKIKTMECNYFFQYFEDRIFKKIKESMIAQLQQVSTKDKLIIQFQERVEEICQFFKPKNSELGYYLNLASIAFKFIDQYVKTQQSNFKKEIHQLNIHFTKILSKIKELATNPQINIFEDLPEKISSDEEDQQSQQQEESKQQFEQKEESKQGKQKEKGLERNCILILPVSIPATGKSVFLKSLIEHFETQKQLSNNASQTSIFVLSSDEIRKRLIDYYLVGNKQCSREYAFQKTQKKYIQMYADELEYLRDQAYQSPSKNVIVFCDKNHPTNAVQKPADIFRVKFPQVKVIGLFPLIEKPLRDFPFSLSYLISCIQRAIKRKNHETLTGDDQRVATIVIFFFKLFRKVDKNEVKELFNEVIEIPFTNENQEQEDELKNVLMKDLREILRTKGGPEEIIKECESAISNIVAYALEHDLGFPDKELQLQVITETLKNCLKSIN